MYRSDISLERLFADAAATPTPVYTPVPKDQQQYYRYWRGACLGRLMLNIIDGIHTIDTGSEGAHFADGVLGAQVFAIAQTQEFDFGQWNAQSRARFGALLFRDCPDQFPAIVVAHAGISPPTTPSDHFGGGMIIQGTRFADLDPYSQEFLGAYFAVDPATL